MKFIKENILGISLAGFVVLATVYGAMVRYDYQSSEVEIVSAEVIGHNHVSLDGSPRHHFVVKLENGSQVKIYDNGEYPVSYRGPVLVSVGKGSQSGRVIYKFTKEGM